MIVLQTLALTEEIVSMESVITIVAALWDLQTKTVQQVSFALLRITILPLGKLTADTST